MESIILINEIALVISIVAFVVGFFCFACGAFKKIKYGFFLRREIRQGLYITYQLCNRSFGQFADIFKCFQRC